MSKQKLLILGGGFAGYWSAVSAIRQARVLGREEELEVTLVSRDEYLTIRPRLYEANLEGTRFDLRPRMADLGVNFIIGEVQKIQADGNSVSVKTGDHITDLSCDSLIVALGSKLSAPPIPGAELGFDTDSFAGAFKLGEHVETLKANDYREPGAKTFLVLGGGLTGLETATSFQERLGPNAPADIRVILLDKSDNVPQGYGPEGAEHIRGRLKELGVETITGVSLKEISKNQVKLSNNETIQTATVIFSTGLKASPLTANINAQRDEVGRLECDEFLRVKGVDGLFSAGDTSKVKVDEEHYAFMSCQHAMPQGKWAGHNAVQSLFQGELKPYAQEQYATCVDLGGQDAAFTMGFERTLQKKGREAKELKTQINTLWISPPEDAETALAQAEPALPGL